MNSDRPNTVEDYGMKQPILGGGGTNTSRLDRHLNILNEIMNGFDRATLQTDNILVKLRGHLSEKVEQVNPSVGQQDVPILQQIDNVSDEILSLVHRYNSAVDELKELT